MRHDPEVLQAASRYQLGLPRMPISGSSGELLGRGSGTSLEFQEHRQYFPGDDVRHLDWAAYARSDTLMIRLYREELSPRLEVLLDVTRSMATTPAKTLIAKQLAALFAVLSGILGGRPTIWLAGDQRPPVSLQAETIDSLNQAECTSTASLLDLLSDHSLALRRQAVRVVISDFLFQHDPETLVRRLAGDASVLWLVQVLTAWESDPQVASAARLVDIESGHSSDLILNRNTVEAYKERLRKLQADLARQARRCHAQFVTVIAENGLEASCRNQLVGSGILRGS